MAARAMLLALAAMIGSSAALAADQADDDAAALVECVSRKAGPEGDLPPSGPVRDRILADMKGGPQACLGTVADACEKAGGAFDACQQRESLAWLATLRLVAETIAGFGKKNVSVYRAGTSGVEQAAVRLCRSAAAVSAWGGEAIRTGDQAFRFDRSNPCVREAIAQQALIVLVNRRGN